MIPLPHSKSHANFHPYIFPIKILCQEEDRIWKKAITASTVHNFTWLQMPGGDVLNGTDDIYMYTMYEVFVYYYRPSTRPCTGRYCTIRTTLVCVDVKVFPASLLSDEQVNLDQSAFYGPIHHSRTAYSHPPPVSLFQFRSRLIIESIRDAFKWISNCIVLDYSQPFKVS